MYGSNLPPPGQVPQLLIEPISHLGFAKQTVRTQSYILLRFTKTTHEIELNSLNAESEK